MLTEGISYSDIQLLAYGELVTRRHYPKVKSS